MNNTNQCPRGLVAGVGVGVAVWVLEGRYRGKRIESERPYLSNIMIRLFN